MADQDKTEKPTAKHLREAREKGQVTRSQDLGAAVVLTAGLIALLVTGPAAFNAVGGAMATVFTDIARPQNVISAAGLHGLENLVLRTLIESVAPVAGICVVAGVLLNIGQVGLRFTPQAARPQLSRINPVNGAKNLVGPRLAVDAGKALTKVGLMAVLVALAVVPDITRLGGTVGATPGAVGALMKHNVTGIAARAAAGYLLIGAIDYGIQRHRMNKSLKMTKQEVKEEFKEHQVSPEIRRALRRRQKQAARARMMAAVPRADVVVCNPTHFAVALEYNGEHPAPVVIAKGQDLIALQIRQIATDHGVPLVENPPLARQLHKAVEIDQMIPGELYAAVAQVLAYVYRLAAKKRVGV